MKTLIITPTYNEKESLPTHLAAVRSAAPDAHLLIVDDNSPDGTGQIAQEAAISDPHIHVMHRPGKNGLGAAYIAAFSWGLQNGYDVLVEMDADGSHRAEDLPKLLAAIDDGADVVLGSRYIPGGAVENWPFSRQFLSRGGNIYIQAVLGIPLRDATGGFRAYTAEALREIDLNKVASQGYCFQVDLAWRAVEAGLEVREVPITFVERVHGVSKMSGDIVREALLRVTVWGVKARAEHLSKALGSIRGPLRGG